MKPSTLYLYTLSAVIFATSAFAYFSDSDGDSRFARMLSTTPDDPMLTEKEIDDFNDGLDANVEKIEKLYQERLAELTAKGEKLTALQKDRLRKKIIAQVWRDYGNFTTLKDGTFFGSMYDISDDYYKKDENDL